MSTKTSEIRKVQGVAGDTSLGLTLPRDYMKALGIRKGDHVRLYKDGGRMIVEKV